MRTPVLTREGSSGRGSATVFVVIALATVLFAGLAVAEVGSLVTAHRRAQAAADLAALAGAGAVVRSADACQAAALVATSNSASLEACEVVQTTVTVVVSVAGPVLLGRAVHLRAESRAGR